MGLSYFLPESFFLALFVDAGMLSNPSGQIFFLRMRRLPSGSMRLPLSDLRFLDVFAVVLMFCCLSSPGFMVSMLFTEEDMATGATAPWYSVLVFAVPLVLRTSWLRGAATGP